MKFRLLFIVSGFLLSFNILHLSCKRNDKLATPGNDLFYYPEKNVYYDREKAIYYYSLDSVRSWDSMVYRGADHGSILGIKIPVKKTGNIAWLQNDSHRNAYNGRVLNIINSNTILLGKLDSINKNKPAMVTRYKKVEENEEVKEDEPPKKGLKKFFNKLFGKKKKKE